MIIRGVKARSTRSNSQINNIDSLSINRYIPGLNSQIIKKKRSTICIEFYRLGALLPGNLKKGVCVAEPAARERKGSI